MSRLSSATYVAPPKPVAASQVPAAVGREMWSPTSATLVYGDRDAVLVDALLTMDEGISLADWVATSGRHLTTIYITHGHGDHFFGATAVLDRFPDARLVATDGTIEEMREHVGSTLLDGYWRQAFPGQLADRPMVAQPLPDHTIELEGEPLVAVELGHSDTDHTTGLHVPSIGLIAAGDAVYNDVHPYLVEAGESGIRSWLTALDTIQALQPTTVVAGHKRDGAPDSPLTIEQTRQYLRDFDDAAGATDSADQLYQAMVERYPDRINRAVPWRSARAAKSIVES